MLLVLSAAGALAARQMARRRRAWASRLRSLALKASDDNDRHPERQRWGAGLAGLGWVVLGFLTITEGQELISLLWILGGLTLFLNRDPVADWLRASSRAYLNHPAYEWSLRVLILAAALVILAAALTIALVLVILFAAVWFRTILHG